MSQDTTTCVICGNALGHVPRLGDWIAHDRCRDAVKVRVDEAASRAAKMTVEIHLTKAIARFPGGWGLAVLSSEGTAWDFQVVYAHLNEQESLVILRGGHSVSTEVLKASGTTGFIQGFDQAILDLANA